MLYFACDWHVRPNVDYDLMMSTATALGSILVQIDTGVDANGCLYYVLALAVPDEATLTAYIEQAGQYLGLTHWYELAAADYDLGELFLDLDGLAAENPALLETILLRLDEEGFQNQQTCPEWL